MKPYIQIERSREKSTSERGTSHCIPLKEELRYRVFPRRAEQPDGSGTTIDMSRRQIRFQTNTPPSPGQFLEVWVNWPVLLNSGCPLQLVVVGQVEESAGPYVVLNIQRYEFKTRGLTAGHAVLGA